MVFTATCLCKEVELEVTTVENAFYVICHCSICQISHSSPCYGGLILQKRDQLSVKKGKEFLTFYKTNSDNFSCNRYFCKNCGTKMFNDSDDHADFVGVSATLMINDLKIKKQPIPKELKNPSGHIYYGSRILTIHDGTFKFETPPMKSFFGNVYWGSFMREYLSPLLLTSLSGYFIYKKLGY
eukprot:gene9401-1609_t